MASYPLDLSRPLMASRTDSSSSTTEITPKFKTPTRSLARRPSLSRLVSLNGQLEKSAT